MNQTVVGGLVAMTLAFLCALSAGDAEAACTKARSLTTGMLVDRCPAAPTPQASKPDSDGLGPWGVSARDWLTLGGPRLRERIHAKDRKDEILAAAARGDVPAMAIAAGAYADDTWGPKDGEASHRYATQAATAGDPRAMYILGNDFTNGLTVTKDEAEGLRWYRLASDQGYVPAYVATGQAFELGRGTDKNLAEAAVWYGKAVPDPLGAYLLSVLRFNGAGVPKDAREAFRLMETAARSEELPEAIYWFGVWLADPAISGEMSSLSESTRWIGKAAEAGHPEAKYQYGARLMEGRGIPTDRTLALHWFEAAGRDGKCIALFQQAYLLAQPGQSAEPGASQAIYERIVADAGACPDAGVIPASFYNLGVIAESAGDRESARKRYRQALAARSETAQAALDKLDEQDTAERQARQNAQLAAANAAARLKAAKAKEAELYAPINGKGSPTRRDILAVHARLNVRYFGGRLTSTVGEQSVQSPFGGDMFYRARSISNPSCAPKAAGVYRCSYDITIRQTANENSILGIFATTFTPETTGRWTYDYVNTKAGWTSKGLETALAKDAADAAAQRASAANNPYSAPCVIKGGASAVWSKGMISGLEWDSGMRTAC